MNFSLCENRQTIINCKGHALVLGGPGSGKTTLALLKAKAYVPTLQPGQEILFLSFSRAAVRQIIGRCKDIFTQDERARIAVRTYHAFCWDVLHSHGKLLGGRSLRMMKPSDEAIAKAGFSGDWIVERMRIFENDGIICFDLFAHGTARLFEESRHMRQHLAEIFPLIIVDEFQDTDEYQWRLVKALASSSTVLCLADPEQRIFDFRLGVNPARINILRETLQPIEINLGGENHRSAQSEILAFADAIMLAKPLPKTGDVVQLAHPPFPVSRDAFIHFAVWLLFSETKKRGVTNPCIAVLAPTNALVAEISDILSIPHNFNNCNFPPIKHEVVWDAEMSAAAALVIASVLEQPFKPKNIGREATLNMVSQYWRLMQASKGTDIAKKRAEKFKKASEQALECRGLKISVARKLCEDIESLDGFKGDPVDDWRKARLVFREAKDLKEIFSQVRTVPLFRATNVIASALSGLWLNQSNYIGAVETVRRLLDRERLIGVEREPRGCVLMTMHKSKGKEFDGVVIIDGLWHGFLLKSEEAPHYERSRRLMRVALTRARKIAIIVRPTNAVPF